MKKLLLLILLSMPLISQAKDEAIYASPYDNANPGQAMPVKYMRQVIYTQRKCDLPIKDADIMRAYVYAPTPSLRYEGCAGRLLNMDFKVIYKYELTTESQTLTSYQEDVMPRGLFYKAKLSKSGDVTISDLRP